MEESINGYIENLFNTEVDSTIIKKPKETQITEKDGLLVKVVKKIDEYKIKCLNCGQEAYIKHTKNHAEEQNMYASTTVKHKCENCENNILIQFDVNKF